MNILDYAKNKIISEFANNFNFKITLAFKSSSVENNLFHIDCKYQLEIPDENPTEFQDRNILNNNELEELEGFRFLLNEINAWRN